MLHFYAPNVHTGGGLVLLRALLAQWPAGFACQAYFDRRAKPHLAIPDGVSVSWCERSVGGRLRAEWALRSQAVSGDEVLCFHSLPPFFSSSARVHCYVHNRHLVGLVEQRFTPTWVNVRISIERFLARRLEGNVDSYIVQTPTMKRALLSWIGDRRGGGAVDIMELPFAEVGSVVENIGLSVSPRWDLIYVSDGVAHKNHRRIFQALRILAEQGFYPSLAVTLPDRDAELIEELDAMVTGHKIKIQNLGHLPHCQVLTHYRQARALLFGSYAESFGLPLLEATKAGVPIIAAELDFVRDMCAPAQTFDPFSEVSIARAIKRFLYDQQDLVTVLTPAQFAGELQALSAQSGGQKSLAS